VLAKLQKEDARSNELIDRVTAYLFSVGVRTSRERAWDIIQNVHRIPYEMLVESNPVIKYQGQGTHISRKHGNQLLSIRDLGKFELKGVSSRKDASKKASIRFRPSKVLQRYIEENIEVI